QASQEDPERAAALARFSGQEEAASTEGDEAGEGEAPAGDKEPLALDSRMVKLNVDGQEAERPLEEVLEAGRRTLQKDHSADQKLRRAASAEQLAAERLADA